MNLCWKKDPSYAPMAIATGPKEAQDADHRSSDDGPPPEEVVEKEEVEKEVGEKEEEKEEVEKEVEMGMSTLVNLSMLGELWVSQ
ncbi:hypothetical protein CYMTET_25693 [Cymbomonas tetramitiformis]|uniref:Uncharacterized protein n=1 Tax=Cymbomonas tetramitiformis TaxID=36881 RepID=A0AAE0KYN0_9CHLO|nr:hypothetical protein CYMTET_25693 [Cymbomonas tetramitiformis]